MKRIFFLAAGVMLSAPFAMAQTGNGSDATSTATATISGIFVPGGVIAGGSFTAPASTPVPSVGAASSVGVTLSTPQGAATFTAALSTTIPAAAAAAITSTLTSLTAGGSMTFGNVAAAVNSWNATMSTLSPAQVRAFVSSPEGRAAVQAMRSAVSSARSTTARAAGSS